MITQTSSKSPKISFMKRWKDAGAFERPWGSRAFKEVSPDTKGVKNGQKFFIVSVVIQFRACKSSGMESHRMYFTRVGLNGEDGAKSIIGGVSLDNDGFVGDPVGKDRGGCESGLKGFE